MEEQNSREAADKKRKKYPGFFVQVTDEEQRQMKKLAASYNETVQKLFKRLVLGVELPRVALNPEGARAIVMEIRRVGNNINQIARHMNEGRARGWYNEFQEAAAELGQIKKLLEQHLGYC